MEITKDDLEYLKTTIGWIIDNTIVNTEDRAYHETFHNSTLNSMGIVERALEKPDTSVSGLHKHIVMPRTFENGLAILLKPNYKAKDGSIKAAYETTVDGHRKWLAPLDDLYGA